MVSAIPSRKNPFPGLRPFREDEEQFFFGRERQVDTMVNKLAATRFLAVVGTSGSGKSSLVNCGLRPALYRGFLAQAGSTWRMAQFRPGSNPIRSLAQALAGKDVLYPESKGEVLLPREEIIETYLNQSAKGVVDAFRKARLPSGTNLLVVADQFEELFRYQRLETGKGTDSAASQNAIAFVNLLLAAAEEPGCPIYVVITMRSDFLGECSHFYGLPEAINQSQYLVPRMTRDERRASIAGPIRVGGAEIDSTLLTRLVNDVGDNPDQLSILQHALHRTWATWQSHGAQGPLSLHHYAEIGTMSEALNQHADEAFKLLATPESIKTCEKLFKALTDLGTDSRGIRRPLKLATLNEIAGVGDSQEQVKSIIEVFRDPTRAFLMPPAPESLMSETVIDISHESLMRVWKRLRLWAEDEARSARQYQRLAETAALEKTGKARLWRDPDLQLALDWKEEASPSKAWAALYGTDFESAMAFLERSRAERDHELAEAVFARWWKRLRFILFIIIAALLVWRLNEGDLENWKKKFGYQEKKKAAQVVTEREPDLAPPIPLPSTEQAPVSKEQVQKEVQQIVKSEGSNYGKLLLALITFLGPYFLGYFALAYSGKWLFRRAAFAKMLRDVTLSSSKAHREETKLAREAREAAVPLHARYAGFWRRAFAQAIDTGLFVLGGVVPSFVGFLFLLGKLTGNPEPAAVYAFLALPFILDWLYQTLMLGSRRQATLGKYVLGLYVTDQDGNRLRFGRASARYLAKLLSAAAAGVGFFVQPFTPKRLAFHDMIVHSVVWAKSDKNEAAPWLAALTITFGVLGLLPFILASLYLILMLVAQLG